MSLALTMIHWFLSPNAKLTNCDWPTNVHYSTCLPKSIYNTHKCNIFQIHQNVHSVDFWCRICLFIVSLIADFEHYIERIASLSLLSFAFCVHFFLSFSHRDCMRIHKKKTENTNPWTNCIKATYEIICTIWWMIYYMLRYGKHTNLYAVHDTIRQKLIPTNRTVCVPLTAYCRIIFHKCSPFALQVRESFSVTMFIVCHLNESKRELFQIKDFILEKCVFVWMYALHKYKCIEAC